MMKFDIIKSNIHFTQMPYSRGENKMTEIKNIAIIGLGLIGGSLAKAIADSMASRMNLFIVLLLFYGSFF